jgi:hypothetical protein
MPSVLINLPSAELVLSRPLSVTGELFLELFAGDASFTLGVILAQVPSMCPWDSKFGERFDVLRSGSSLLALIQGGYISSSHLGTPCQSMTWCRSPQLRSAKWPRGVPGLSNSQQELVELGNSLLEFSVHYCTILYAHGGYFSIENPELSWLWLQPETIELYSLPGVSYVSLYYKSYGTPYMKPTLFLHNSPVLHRISTPTGPLKFSSGADVGKIVLRGMCWWEGKRVFRTHLAQPYPPDLAEHFGRLTSEALGLRSQALSACMDVPMAPSLHDEGLPMQLLVSLSGQGGDEDDRVSPELPQAASQQPNSGRVEPSEPVASCADCPDPDEPFVSHGLGAPKGLSVFEHVVYACSVPHPFISARADLPDDLLYALDFVCNNNPGQVDLLRGERLHRLTMMATELEAQRQEWARGVLPPLKPIVSRFHGPLFEYIYHEIQYDDPQFLKDLRDGFPLLGVLPPSCGSCDETPPKSSSYTEEELRDNRRVHNELVLAALRADEWEGDIWDGTMADAEAGFMSEPVPLDAVDLDRVTLTRRLGVREERAAGWRTRVVDHFTESGVNPATQAQDRPRHDTTDVLAEVLLHVLRAGQTPQQWKRDVSQAFRRVPIQGDHLEYAWVVFLRHGVPYVAQHRGMPFGTSSAVYGWHRVGHFLRTALVKLFLAPAGRYVDDYFGAEPQGIRITGGRCLSALSFLLGVPTEPGKDDDDRACMTVLGVDCEILPDRAAVSLKVDAGKAERWSAQLEEVLERGSLEPGQASKLAGRLSFAVSAAAGKVGRAFLKPFYAQAHDPLPGNRASPRLLRAAEWFVHYLRIQPPVVQEACLASRPHVRTWSDAAGVSRWVAAVAEVDGKFLWTRVRTPDCIWDQLLERGDQQIGVQEMLGVALAWGTFRSRLHGALWTAYVDNQGVLGAILKGGSGAPEVNMAVGHLWLDLAACTVGLHVARVESKANVADGPSRDEFSELDRLGATYVEPELPQWAYDLWGMPRPA